MTVLDLPLTIHGRYAPTHAGKILAEFTVTRVGTDGDGTHDFYLCASRDYAQHDLAWLEQQRRELEQVGRRAGSPIISPDLP